MKPCSAIAGSAAAASGTHVRNNAARRQPVLKGLAHMQPPRWEVPELHSDVRAARRRIGTAETEPSRHAELIRDPAIRRWNHVCRRSEICLTHGNGLCCAADIAYLGKGAGRVDFVCVRNNPLRTLACALLLLCLAAPSASALEPGKVFHDYASDSWSAEQGLPQITMLSITQD